MESGIQGIRALAEQGFSVAVVDRLGRHEADTGMPMLGVVPAEELLAVSSGILDTAESSGKLGAVFQGFELRLGEWIVIRDIRLAVAFGHLEIDQQGCHWF